MTRLESNSKDDTPVWSARNLPKPTAPRMQRFSVLAVAAGLVAIVLTSTLQGPIQTAGTRMEPARFQVSVQNRAATVRAGSAMPPVMVASAPVHR